MKTVSSAELEKYKILVIDLQNDKVATEALGLLQYEDIFNYDDAGNIWNKDYPSLAPLKDKIISGIDDYQLHFKQEKFGTIKEIDGWCVSTPDSNTHLKKHHHRGHAHLTCLYYAWVDPADTGPLEIYQEDDQATEPHMDHFLFTPFTGALIFFPGGSPHRVRPYTRLRLSIASNIKFSTE